MHTFLVRTKHNNCIASFQHESDAENFCTAYAGAGQGSATMQKVTYDANGKPIVLQQTRFELDTVAH